MNTAHGRSRRHLWTGLGGLPAVATALVMIVATLAMLAGPGSAGGSAYAATAGAGDLEDYASYDAQITCAAAAGPGTAYLLDWLVRAYPGTGATGTLRPCDSGGASEHKDGRALDWGVDAADPAQAATAADFLERIFAADRAGNPHALARRMGVMYVIWNDHIWSAYDGFRKRDYLSGGCRNLRSCSKTLRHRDHVHLSLSRAGAAAQTSWYRGRGVDPVPVLIPGTRRLDPVSTAIVALDVPTNGDTVHAPFKLTRGTTYRLVADGRYRYGAAARIGDAACRWSARKHTWVPNPRGLLVDGQLAWAGDCDGSHSHEATYTPRRTGLLDLRIDTPRPRFGGDTLRFYVLREDLPTRSVATTSPPSRRAPRAPRNAGPRARALTKEVVEVRARARRGAQTERALRRGERYRVVVTGQAGSGDLVFDGNCVQYAGRLRPQHSVDLARPEADHFSLFVQGVPVALRVPGRKADCAPNTHRYVGRFRAVVHGKARIKIWDPYEYADNDGALRVRLVRR